MRRRDDGFTLVEVLVSIGLISVVTSALTMFFVQSRASIQVQSQYQQAAQLVSAQLDRLSLLPGLSLVTNRPANCVTDQFNPATGSPLTAVPDAVRTRLTGLTPLPDVSFTQTVPITDCLKSTWIDQEPMPTEQVKQLTVNGQTLAFTQDIYIGTCNLKVNSTTLPTCGTTTGLPTVKIVVAISWSGKCAGGTCVYVNDSLVPQALSDVVFNLPA
jgi:prepilin-type N-terminal cleavage/methylation domain-containing protein